MAFLFFRVGSGKRRLCGSIFSFSVCESSLSYLFCMICCSFAVAAEQKARTTYDNILRLVKDPEVCDPIRFLREREIVHYQRFGEGLRLVQEKLDSRNFYAFNPEFDNKGCR